MIGGVALSHDSVGVLSVRLGPLNSAAPERISFAYLAASGGRVGIISTRTLQVCSKALMANSFCHYPTVVFSTRIIFVVGFLKLLRMLMVHVVLAYAILDSSHVAKVWKS